MPPASNLVDDRHFGQFKRLVLLDTSFGIPIRQGVQNECPHCKMRGCLSANDSKQIEQSNTSDLHWISLVAMAFKGMKHSPVCCATANK